MHTPVELQALIQAEIEAVHDFIAAWFRGEGDGSPEAFAQGLADRLAADLVNIQPSGRTLTRAGLIDPMAAAFGVNREFQIAISDVEVRFVDAVQGLVLATYVEHQSGARNTTPSSNSRVSTVLFRLGEDGQRPTWLHIHETAWPGQ